MKRTLLIITSILLLIMAPLAIYWLSQRPLPPLDGSELCPGLEKAVVVKFDAHAVPYIGAYSEPDAYQVQGYITARERLFQMDMLRRSALGQLSQVYGIDCLASDRLMRTLGMQKLAQAEWQNLSTPARETLEAYAKGVNAYLGEYAGKLPLEFTLLGYKPSQWRPEDSLAIMKYLAYKLDDSWRLDDFRQRVANKIGDSRAAELFRDDLVGYGLPASTSPAPAKAAPPGKRTSVVLPGRTRAESAAIAGKLEARQASPGSMVGAPQTISDRLLEALAALGNEKYINDNSQPLWGSTAWVVPAQNSQSGGALLACDKDGLLTVPCNWFLCSLNTPQLHVAGASLAGVPGIMIGRNESVCWGSANLKADVQDIFLEQFKSQFDSTYKIPGSWAEAEVTTESIPVRFGQDVEHRIFVTRHGPVLLRINEAAISLSWAGSNTDHPAFEALFKLNHANNFQDINEALALYDDPPQMFVFADRMGNIGYRTAGNIPVRIGGGQGTMLNSGWENKGTWQGFLPADKLPHWGSSRTTGNTSQTATDSGRQHQPATSSGYQTTQPTAARPAGAVAQPIVAANQRPAAEQAANAALPSMDNSLFLGHQWLPPYRANRLLSALITAAASMPLSATEMNQLQGDQFSLLAPIVTKTLQDAAVQSNYIDRNGINSVAMLLKWDGQLRASGAQASIFESFLQTLTRRSLEPTLGRELTSEYLQRWPLWLTQAERIMREKPANMLPPEERTYNTFFLTTLVQAMKSLHISLADETPAGWLWGKAHQALFFDQTSKGNILFNFSRLFRLGPVSVGGANECINSCDVRPDPKALTFWCQSGPTERMIVDMGDINKFYQSISTGQSGHLFSPYRDDQLRSWCRVDLIPIAFSPTQTMRQIQHRLVLENEFGSN